MSLIVLVPHMAMARSSSFFRISKMWRTPFSPSTRQGVAQGCPDKAGSGAQSERLQHVNASPHAPIEIHFATPTDGIDNVR